MVEETNAAINRRFRYFIKKPTEAGDGDRYIQFTWPVAVYNSPSLTPSTLPCTAYASILAPPDPTRTQHHRSEKQPPFPSTPSSRPRTFFSPPTGRPGRAPRVPHHHYRPPGLDDYRAQHRDDRLLAAPLLPQRRRPAPGKQGRAQPRRRQRERRHRRAQLRRRAALPLGAVPRHPGT
jgi:hypothetical protein